MKYITVFCVAFFFNLFLYAQSDKEISFLADRLEVNEDQYPDATLLSKVNKQVHFMHKGIDIWCDQAVHYAKDQFVKAFGDVKILQGDTITLQGDYAEYNGRSEFAYISSNVKLVTPSNRLTTDTLFFDRKRQQAFYRSGGKLVDSVNTLTSQEGRYFFDQNKYSFKKKVKVKNPEHTITSPRLDYFTEQKDAYLYGPSLVKTSKSSLSCERGYYNTNQEWGYAIKNARIDYESRKVYGDSIFYDSKRNFASAVNNIKVVDLAYQSLIKGHYAEVYRGKDSLFITKRALAITKRGKDSTFIHCDTLMITGSPKHRLLRGFRNVKLYKHDMSGKCDSVSSFQKTGVTKMLGTPVLWVKSNQMTGDTIHLLTNMKTRKLDSLKVFKNAFLVQQDTLKQGFNQIKGATLDGVFNENSLSKVYINKNAETIYFQRDNSLNLIGINKIFSSSIEILFEKNQLSDVYYYDNIEGTLFKPENISEEDRVLNGLNWRGDEAILSKDELFWEDEPFDLIKIKGIPLPDHKNFFDKQTLRRLNRNKSDISRFKDVPLKQEPKKELHF